MYGLCCVLGDFRKVRTANSGRTTETTRGRLKEAGADAQHLLDVWKANNGQIEPDELEAHLHAIIGAANQTQSTEARSAGNQS